LKKWPRVNIKIGAGSNIDEDVIIGYPTGRSIESAGVSIGSQATIRSGSVIYDCVTIGNRFATGHHVIIREETQIGDAVEIWTHTVIDYGCQIGSRVKIHTNVYIPQDTLIEDEVFIAPGATFANDKYPVSHKLDGPRIRQGAKIGVNATLLPGVVIGKSALVGAGCVVTKDVPDSVVVVGNPGKVIGRVEDIVPKKNP